MRSFTKGNVKIAVASLKANKARSYLTMLGIIIGISSVVTIVSIGQGIKQQVNNQINHVGKDLITVQPSRVQNSGVNVLSPVRVSGGLSTNDLKAVSQTKGIAMAVPLGVIPGNVRGDHGSYTKGPVIAAGPDLAAILNQGIGYGTFFMNDDDENNVAVLGSHAAIALFGDPAPLGQSFTFRGQSFIVRGVFNEFSSAPLTPDVDFNGAIFIPYAIAKRLTNDNANIYEILVKPTLAQDESTVIATMQNSLFRLHGNSNDVSVLRQSQVAAQTSSVLSLLTELIAGAAAVSLLVGGIGIMNVMLVSVTERMHEVGIRKAVGATNRQILNEFLTEATVLSIVGGLLGIVVSLIANLVLRTLTNLTPVVQWQIIVLATLVSIAVGIIFGSAPALKAARKDPISALRNE